MRQAATEHRRPTMACIRRRPTHDPVPPTWAPARLWQQQGRNDGRKGHQPMRSRGPLSQTHLAVVLHRRPPLRGGRLTQSSSMAEGGAAVLAAGVAATPEDGGQAPGSGPHVGTRGWRGPSQAAATPARPEMTKYQSATTLQFGRRRSPAARTETRAGTEAGEGVAASRTEHHAPQRSHWGSHPPRRRRPHPYARVRGEVQWGV